MINIVGKIYLIIFFILSIHANAVENKIVYKVNNEIITSLDIINEIKYLKILNPKINNLDEETIEIKSNYDEVVYEYLPNSSILHVYKKKE